MALAAPCQSAPPPTLAQLCRRIQDISTLPCIAMRVMEVANDPNSGPREVKEVLEADAALSARVLRSVNSSAYAVRTKITNLQHAIAFLGIKQIRNLAMTVSVSHLFANEEAIGPYNRKQLWTHLVAVGVCARMLAMRLRSSEFEDVFLAGLLHDLGIILEDEHASEQFVPMVRSLQAGEALCDAEQAYLGFTHTALGESIAKTWKLPQGVVDTIRYHHNSAACHGASLKTVQYVEVANFVCSAKGITSTGLQLVQLPKEAIVSLALTKDDLLALISDLDGELAKNQGLLQV